ncbi:MAG TPA: PilZ domain-containing protein [Tepidisphaeraceae bacterium]|jgi:hypothetical protein|nr:PilZ domain-containing protein [Tepidisphaeraceae bacterium]
MSQLTDPTSLRLATPPAIHDRRKDHRRPVLTKAIVKILDGLHAGRVFEVLTRDLSMSGLSFLLREPLGIGHNVLVEMAGAGGRGQITHQCEIVRSRPVSNGRFEMALQFRGEDTLHPTKRM